MPGFNRRDIEAEHYVSNSHKPKHNKKGNNCGCDKGNKKKHSAVSNYDPRNMSGWIVDPCDKYSAKSNVGYNTCDSHKTQDCSNCDPNCCANPCIDVQKDILSITKCTEKFTLDQVEIEIDSISVIFEVILTNKTCECLTFLQIQDSLAGISSLGTDLNGIAVELEVTSCDENICILCSEEILDSCGKLLDHMHIIRN